MKRIATPITTTEKCSYGCGNDAKYINGSRNLMCDVRSSKCPEVRRKNSEAPRDRDYKETYKNLPEETKIRMNQSKGKFKKADFSLNGKGNHKSILLQERGHCCESCGLREWLDKPIPLELEHIDGNNRNNIKDNLKLLCPNCHAQTPTYRGRNKNSGKIKVSDQKILDEIETGCNIRQTLINVGLAPKGGNYKRVKRLMRL